MIGGSLSGAVFEGIKVRWKEYNDATVLLFTWVISESLLRPGHLQFLYEMSPRQVGRQRPS